MKESKIPKFRRCVLQNFPFIEEDFDALTDYELLCKVVQYLNIVIDHQNNVDEKIEGLTEEFEELKSYVDNYFANLDVQEEINNKLEEMAEGGQLSEIIAQFLAVAPVLGYGTIAEMAAGSNMVNGSIAYVLGNSLATDGDGAFYLVLTKESGESADGFEKVAIGDTLIGHRIKSAAIEEITSSPINVKFYGAKGDGETDDSTVLQSIINNNPRATLYFPSGDYLVRSGLKVNHKNPVSFKFEHDARLFTDTTLTCLLDLATDRDPDPDEHFHVMTDPYITRIDGGVFDCDNCQYGIRTQSSGARLWINGITMINVDYYGIYLNQDAYYSSVSANIQNVNIAGKNSGSSNASTAIYTNGHDSKFYNISIVGTKIGMDLQSAGNYVNTVHPVAQFGANNEFTTAQFNATVAFRINGDDNTLMNCYADTYGRGFDIHSRMNTTLNNCFTYWWQSPNDAETYCVHFNDVYDPYAIIVNCNFRVAGHGTKHIIYHPSGTHFSIQLCNNVYGASSDGYDLAYNSSLNKKNTVIPFVAPATQLSTNSYYLLGYIERGNFTETSFDISNGSTKYHINIVYVSAGATIYKGNIYGSTFGVDLVIADAETISGKTYAKVYIKTKSDTTWSQYSLTNVTGDALYIQDLHSKTAVSAPTTVLVYSEL